MKLTKDNFEELLDEAIVESYRKGVKDVIDDLQDDVNKSMIDGYTGLGPVFIAGFISHWRKIK